MKTLRARVILALLAIGMFLSCERTDEAGGFLRREMADLQARTVPPGSGVTSQAGPFSDGWSKTTRWELETKWEWAQYKSWVTRELRPDFEITRVEQAHLVWARTLRGDMEELTLEAGLDGHVLKVECIVVIYPD